MEALKAIFSQEPFVDDLGDLKAYTDHGSEEAFQNLVERYSSLVFGTCFRRLKDHGFAEDATQATFMVLVFKVQVS